MSDSRESLREKWLDALRTAECVTLHSGSAVTVTAKKYAAKMGIENQWFSKKDLDQIDQRLVTLIRHLTKERYVGMYPQLLMTMDFWKNNYPIYTRPRYAFLNSEKIKKNLISIAILKISGVVYLKDVEDQIVVFGNWYEMMYATLQGDNELMYVCSANKITESAALPLSWVDQHYPRALDFLAVGRELELTPKDLAEFAFNEVALLKEQTLGSIDLDIG